MRASIDLGSNSVLLLVLDDAGNTVHDEARVVGLGKGLGDRGLFRPDRMDATFTALEDYARRAAALGVAPKDIRAAATSASRRAMNADTSSWAPCASRRHSSARPPTASRPAIWDACASTSRPPSLEVGPSGPDTSSPWQAPPPPWPPWSWASVAGTETPCTALDSAGRRFDAGWTASWTRTRPVA